MEVFTSSTATVKKQSLGEKRPNKHWNIGTEKKYGTETKIPYFRNIPYFPKKYRT